MTIKVETATKHRREIRCSLCGWLSAGGWKLKSADEPIHREGRLVLCEACYIVRYE